MTENSTPDRLLLLLNAHHEPVEFKVSPRGPWNVVPTSGEPDESPELDEDQRITVQDQSLVLLRSG